MHTYHAEVYSAWKQQGNLPTMQENKHKVWQSLAKSGTAADIKAALHQSEYQSAGAPLPKHESEHLPERKRPQTDDERAQNHANPCSNRDGLGFAQPRSYACADGGDRRRNLFLLPAGRTILSGARRRLGASRLVRSIPSMACVESKIP